MASINASGAVAKMKSIANGGGGKGVASKTTNPGSPVQAVGKDGKHVPNAKQGMANGENIHFSG